MTPRVRWEERVQARTVTFWDSVPFAYVYDLSQGVRSGGKKHATTRQTPGLPDLIVVLSDFGVTVFQEVKAFTADELRPHLDPVRWRSCWKPISIFRASMQTPVLYSRAIAQISPEKRAELYRKKRTSDQVLLEARLAGQAGIVYCCGGVEEAFACYEGLQP